MAESGLAIKGRRRGRPPASQAGQPTLPPGHRCVDADWRRVHGMTRGHKSTNMRWCRICQCSFESLAKIACMCPCCGEEA